MLHWGRCRARSDGRAAEYRRQLLDGSILTSARRGKTACRDCQALRDQIDRLKAVHAHQLATLQAAHAQRFARIEARLADHARRTPRHILDALETVHLACIEFSRAVDQWTAPRMLRVGDLVSDGFEAAPEVEAHHGDHTHSASL
jgi:hypothetical protein